jgi:Kef-type K+ transport system membrane component KefB
MHGQTDTLLLTLFTIFVWAKVFAEIFERLHLPAVLGEILAGVILGPFATGFVPANETVNSIAEIGAVFLLFTVGLETSPTDLIRVGRVAATVAAAGVLLPFAFGFLYLFWRHEPTHEAIFVAAAMVATSVGITARVLRDMHVLKARTSQIILGAAVFDDILGMVLLGLVVSLATGGGVQWLHLGIVTVEAVGFAMFMIFAGPRLVRRMQPGLRRMQTHDAPLILALAICLGLSVVSTKIGMAAIIGAFFAGLAFADFSDSWNLEPRAQAINQFLSPFFFFTMGSRLDLTVITGPVVTTAIVVSIIAILTKVVGCGVPMIKDGWKDALKVGVGMTPRGEVALIVALIGLQMNMISQRAYAVVIFMAAITTIIPPPILKLLYRDEAPTGALDLDLQLSAEEQVAEENVRGEIS